MGLSLVDRGCSTHTRSIVVADADGVKLVAGAEKLNENSRRPGLEVR